MANKTSSLKSARSQRLWLFFYSCQCNLSSLRKKITEPYVVQHNSWCHLHELTAFPDVDISLSESKLCIRARHKAGLCPLLSPLTEQCSQSGYSGAASFPLPSLFEYCKHLFPTLFQMDSLFLILERCKFSVWFVPLVMGYGELSAHLLQSLPWGGVMSPGVLYPHWAIWGWCESRLYAFQCLRPCLG